MEVISQLWQVISQVIGVWSMLPCDPDRSARGLLQYR